jgi:hypothetical protein
VLKAGVAGVVASQAAVLENLAVMPSRMALAATRPSDIQFDIGAFIAPAKTFNDGAGDVVAQFGPVFAVLAPAKLTRTPTIFDQFRLRDALETIESNFPMSPAGVFVHVHYGLPYFRRLGPQVFQRFVPRLVSDNTRFVLEEAVASPTDVINGFVGGVSPDVKDRFNVNLAIERNDVLFQIKSDSLSNANQVLAWLEGNTNTLNGQPAQAPDFRGLFQFQTARVQFTQPGLPRKVADQAAAGNPNLYEFHGRVNPRSSMVMGFVDQQSDSSAPSAQVVTFQGTNTARLTTARAGDYFDNGAICHFSHDIDDLYQFYKLANQDSRRPEAEVFTERFQYMFRSNQLGTPHGLASEGFADPFKDGGGPAFINNVFQGTDSAFRDARNSAGTFTPTNATQDANFTGTRRFGHEEALQRSSRAADGTPLHIRNDGPGFSSLDVPGFRTFPGANGVDVAAGSTQFKLEFLIFVQTAEFFRVMRANSASVDLVNQFAIADDDAALERFITATRRQNFLTPPRRNRSFPLVEKQ